MVEASAKVAGVNVRAPVDAEAGQPGSSRVCEGDFVTQNEERDLSRGLQQRHISLIAIAGAIVSACLPSRIAATSLTCMAGHWSLPRTRWLHSNCRPSRCVVGICCGWTRSLRCSVRFGRDDGTSSGHWVIRPPC